MDAQVRDRSSRRLAESRPTGDGRYRVSVPDDAEAATVHWGRESVWDVQYGFDQGLWGRALHPAPLRAAATFAVGGVPVRLETPLEASYIDVERVQRRRPLAVGPAVSVRFATPERILAPGLGGLRGRGRAREPRGRRAWRAKCNSGDTRRVGGSSRPLFRLRSFARTSNAAPVFTVTPPADADGRQRDPGGRLLRLSMSRAASFESIAWPELETAWVSEPAMQHVRAMPLEVAKGLHIGYVMGSGDKVPAAVTQLGAESSPCLTRRPWPRPTCLIVRHNLDWDSRLRRPPGLDRPQPTAARLRRARRRACRAVQHAGVRPQLRPLPLP